MDIITLTLALLGGASLAFLLVLVLACARVAGRPEPVRPPMPNGRLELGPDRAGLGD